MLFIFFVLVQSTEDCPIVKCGPLGTGICAEINEEYILVNKFEGICENGFECNFYDIIFKLWNNEDGYVNCTEIEEAKEWTQYEMKCPSLNEMEKLRGTELGLIECNTPENCYNIGGLNNQTECVCGFDGYYYCEPTINDDYFKSFWDSCEENDGHIVLEEYLFYMSKVNFYIWTETLPFCLNENFKDITLYSGEYQGGGTILLVGLSFIINWEFKNKCVKIQSYPIDID